VAKLEIGYGTQALASIAKLKADGYRKTVYQVQSSFGEG
jgi:hypothetical protein